MKIIELVNRPSVAISNEEADVLLQFDDSTPIIEKSDLSERQQIIANQLVNKDLLTRKHENGKIVYKKRTG